MSDQQKLSEQARRLAELFVLPESARLLTEEITKLVENQLAEAQTSNQRMRDLVRYKRHDLFNDGLIDQSEFASLVAETPGAVSRLEGYDKIKAQLAEAQNRIDAMRRKYCAVTESPEGAFERLTNERDAARADAEKSVVLEVVRRAGYKERSRAERDASLDRETLAGHVRSGEKLSDVQAERDALAKALQNVAEAISSAASTYARLPQDLSIERREAWVYGILLGWHTALPDVAVRHGWTEQEVIRLKRYREALASLERPACKECNGTRKVPNGSMFGGWLDCPVCQPSNDI